MIPFNLDSARRGDPVCTADGREVRLYAFDAPCVWSGKPQPIAGVVKSAQRWELASWCEDGMHRWDTATAFDLRMAQRKETRWVVTYRIGKATAIHSSAYETENDAREAVASLQADYCKRHSFSINPIEVEL